MCDVAIKFHQIISDVSLALTKQNQRQKKKKKRGENNPLKWRQIKIDVFSSWLSAIHFIQTQSKQCIIHLKTKIKCL